MRYLLGIAAIVVAGFLIWQIGARLSTDAVGMGMGLVFGMLAGIPAALLVFAATGRQRDDGAAYEAGYSAGVRDATDMARGIVRQLPAHRPAVIVVNPPADDDDVIDVDAYTYAYPFGRQFRIAGEVE